MLLIVFTGITGIIIAEIPNDNYNLFAWGNNEKITELNKFRKFSGTTFSLEGRYATNFHELIISTSFNGRMTVVTEHIQISENTTEEIEYLLSTYTPSVNRFINSSKAILSEWNFGYLYRINRYSGLNLEIHKQYPLNIPENAALFNIMPPDQTSIHFGNYYQIQNSSVGLWNNVNLRLGSYLKELNFTGIRYLDYGLTMGLGVEFLANTQSIDLALMIGEKESIIINDEYEKYISFHIGFIKGEKWFMKRRRK